jgi:hypothetical protein
MKISKALLVVLVLHVAGCATFSAQDCRNTSWFKLGSRDGLATWYRSIDKYAAVCESSGFAADRGEYERGWLEGQWLKAQRIGGR